MTVIVGVLCSDGIVIGADSAATSAIGQQPMVRLPTDKLAIIGGKVIVAGTGAVGLASMRNARRVSIRRLGMKHLGLLAALALLCVPLPALADQSGYQVLPGGCGTASFSGSGTRAATQTPNGQLCAGASYLYTSTGFVGVGSFSTSTGLTPPAGSTVCFIQAEGEPVRFRTDGTAPTATVGQLLAVGAVLKETANLAGIEFIPTTGSATLDADCYK